MDQNKLNALFAMQAAFPHMRKSVSDGLLNIEIYLLPEENDFFEMGARMFESI